LWLIEISYGDSLRGQALQGACACEKQVEVIYALRFTHYFLKALNVNNWYSWKDATRHRKMR
jgi:hypothetical protein